MIPPKRFAIFPPLTGGCSEGLDAIKFYAVATPVHGLLDRTRSEEHLQSSNESIKKKKKKK